VADFGKVWPFLEAAVLPATGEPVTVAATFVTDTGGPDVAAINETFVTLWRQSYDFYIHNFYAIAVVSWSVFKSKINIFVFKTHLATLGVVNLYSAWSCKYRW
jgi:hypothetical protein